MNLETKEAIVNKSNLEVEKNDLKKLYLEITSHCNLNCTMCTRKNWQNEGIGHMSKATFSKVLKDLPNHPELKTVFLGGIGEPLTHPDLIEMITALCKRDLRVEMISNGTLLTKEMSGKLIDAGLNMLWVSVDGAFSVCYEDIRQGATANNLYKNLEGLCEAKIERGIFDVHIYDLNEYLARETLQLGLAFVAMKRNIKELPKLIQESRKLGVREIKVTHVIPYTKEMVNEALYDRTVLLNHGQPRDPLVMHVDLPLMDWNEDTTNVMAALYNSHATFSHMDIPMLRRENYCRFVQEGQSFVRWDGEICPCMALLHDGKTYLNNVERHITGKSFGNINDNDKSLSKIWYGEEYSEFRKKVRDFVYSPCVTCGECTYLEDNQEDCYGDTFPTCGGCLWAQGLVQCP